MTKRPVVPSASNFPKNNKPRARRKLTAISHGQDSIDGSERTAKPPLPLTAAFGIPPRIGFVGEKHPAE